MTANVILAKCSKHNKSFGVRVEKRENDWVRTWAFPIDEAKAKREGFHKTKIKGSLDDTPEYPGCPHCGCHNLLQCYTCNNMICWNGESTSVYCHHCNTQINDIETVESFDVKSGGY